MNWPLPADVGWCDDFDDGFIDQDKWRLPSDVDLIYERDEVLNFNISQPNANVVGSSIAANILDDRRIEDIYYMTTLRSYVGDIPTGVGLGILLANDKYLSLDLGSGPNGPGFEFSICPDPSADYEECEHLDGPDAIVGVPTFVRLVHVNDNLDFYLDGIPYLREDAHEPITAVEFYLFADPGGIIHVEMDDVCIIAPPGEK
jgi:hypothetical protein